MSISIEKPQSRDTNGEVEKIKKAYENSIYKDGILNGLKQKFSNVGTLTEYEVSKILEWPNDKVYVYLGQPIIYVGNTCIEIFTKKDLLDKYVSNVSKIFNFLTSYIAINLSADRVQPWIDAGKPKRTTSQTGNFFNKSNIQQKVSEIINNEETLITIVNTYGSVTPIKTISTTSPAVDFILSQLLSDRSLMSSIIAIIGNLKQQTTSICNATNIEKKHEFKSANDKDFWRDFAVLILSDILNSAPAEEPQPQEIQEEEEDKKEQSLPNYLDNSEQPAPTEEQTPQEIQEEEEDKKENKKDDDNMSVGTSATLKRDSSSDDLFDVKPAKTEDLPIIESMKKLTQKEKEEAGVIGDDEEETEEERKAREEAERRQKLIDEENEKQAVLRQQQEEELRKKQEYEAAQKQHIQAVKNELLKNTVSTMYPGVYSSPVDEILNFCYNGDYIANSLLKQGGYDANIFSNDTISEILNMYVRQYNKIFSDKGVYTKYINENPNSIFADVAKKGYVAKDDIFKGDSIKTPITFGSFVHTLNKTIDIFNSIAERRGLPIIGKQPIQTSVSPVFKAMDMIEKNKNNPNILYNTNETTLITKSYWDKQNDKIIDDLVRSGTIVKMQRGTDGEDAYDYNGTKFTRDEILTTVKKAKISNLTQSRAVFNNLQLSQMRAGDKRRNRFERRKEKYISINKGAVTKVQKLFEEDKVKVGGMTLNPLLFRKSMC